MKKPYTPPTLRKLSHAEGVTRLPVQHPKAPHCEACGASVPPFELTLFPVADWTLMAVTFHVRCPCGAPWDLRKTVKS